MLLRKGVLAAALLSLAAGSRAEDASGQLTPERLIQECSSDAKNPDAPKVKAESAALAASYKREIHAQAPDGKKSPITPMLTRGNKSVVLTMIADPALKAFVEGPSPNSSQPGLAHLRNGCRIAATSEKGWAVLGYLQSRMELADDIKRTEKFSRAIQEAQKFLPTVSSPREKSCSDEDRRADIIDALAFKKIFAPGDSSAEPIAGQTLIPLAQANLRCD